MDRVPVPWREASKVEDIPVFAGDFFGQNYEADEFPGFEPEEREMDSDSEADPLSSESSDNRGPIGDESQWEPPHPTTEDSKVDDSVDPDEPMPDTGSTYATNSLRNIDIYIDHFPGRASKIVGPIPSSNDPAHVQYMNQVEGRSNPWAPFVLEMDWEIVKWAKL